MSPEKLLVSREFYQLLCVFILQRGHRWRLKGSEQSDPWRRHIYELRAGDGKEETEGLTHV